MRFFNLFTPARTEIVRRRLADVRLSGRSMVEMLGVLALIGVLSVGAISGYSKAMFKYKLNNFSESFNLLLNNAIQMREEMNRSFGAPSYAEASSQVSVFDKLGLIPDGMTVKGNLIYDVFDNSYTLRYYLHPNGYKEYLLISTMSKAGTRISKQKIELCRTMIVVAKENAGNLNQLQIRVGSEGDETALNLPGDLKSVCKKSRCLRNITLSDVDDFCNTCSNTGCGFVVYLM